MFAGKMRTTKESTVATDSRMRKMGVVSMFHKTILTNGLRLSL